MWHAFFHCCRVKRLYRWMDAKNYLFFRELDCHITTDDYTVIGSEWGIRHFSLAVILFTSRNQNIQAISATCVCQIHSLVVCFTINFALDFCIFLHQIYDIEMAMKQKCHFSHNFPYLRVRTTSWEFLIFRQVLDNLWVTLLIRRNYF